MKSPLVSVIMPAFNSEKFIAEAVESVIKQSYSNWELIVVDDASTDATPQIIDKYTQLDPRIFSIKLPTNNGPSYCRNKATEIAKGVYIAFLDSDDLWTLNKLKFQIEFMIDRDCAVSFTNYLRIDEVGNSLNKRVKAIDFLSLKKQLRNNYIGNLTGMYNVTSLGKIMSPKILKRQDWALWLEAIKRSGKPAQGIPQDLAFYRIREKSLSANKIGLLQYNYYFYKKHLQFSTLKSLYFMGCFLWEYFFIRPRYIENE